MGSGSSCLSFRAEGHDNVIVRRGAARRAVQAPRAGACLYMHRLSDGCKRVGRTSKRTFVLA